MTTYPEGNTPSDRRSAKEAAEAVELRRFCVELAVHNAVGRNAPAATIIADAAQIERYVRDGAPAAAPTMTEVVQNATSSAIQGFSAGLE